MVSAALRLLILVFSVQAFAAPGDVHLVPDTEGMWQHIQTLEDRGFLKVTRDSKGLILDVEITDVGSKFYFLGDIIRRGPDGAAIMDVILKLEQKYPNQVFGIVGNHDINGIGFTTMVPALQMGLIPDFQDWCKTKNADPKLLESMLSWWAERYGLENKVQNFWLEKIVRKTGQNPADFLNEKNQIDIKKLEAQKIVTKSQMAKQFLLFYSPESSSHPAGDGWRYMEAASFIRKARVGDQDVYLDHSGMYSVENFGIIPDQGNWRDNHSKTWQDEWIKSYRKYNVDELGGIANEINTFFGSHSLDEKAKIADSLLKNNYIKRNDASWDYQLNQIVTDPQSHSYPDQPDTYGKTSAAVKSIPPLPSEEILKSLTQNSDSIIVGGHVPVGAAPVVETYVNPVTGHRFVAIHADSSYADLEGRSDVTIKSDGTIVISGPVAPGVNRVLELPTQKGFQDLEAKLQARISEAQKITDPAAKKAAMSDIDNESHRLEDLKKMGMGADGWSIQGFATRTVETNGKKQEVPDYNNLILMKQDGHHFEYKSTDRWALDKVELQLHTTNFRELYKEARKKMVDMLQKERKTVLTKKEVVESLSGRNLVNLLGPTETFAKVAEKNPEAVKKVLRDFESELRSTPDTAKVTFVGAGTIGLESELSKIVNKVSAERVGRGAEAFDYVGLITSVTKRDFLDPNVKKFCALKSFYWDEQPAEILEILRQVKDRPSLKAYIYGGSGTMSKFITRDWVPAMKTKLPDLEITFFEGVQDPDKMKVKKEGADQFIDMMRNGTADTKGISENRIKIVASHATPLPEIVKAPPRLLPAKKLELVRPLKVMRAKPMERLKIRRAR